LLATREHSQQELLEKIEKRGFETRDPLLAVQELEEQGLQSDERFAREYTRSKVKSGYGPIRIKRGLLEKGVEKKMALGSLKELEIDWFECAKRTYDKKFNSEIRDIKDYARRVRFLVYKGFETVHVKAVMGEWDNQ
tara:strand:+ start:303 stop:713 length:411 start_codon:yes stop_codon:yes gene_type:complete